MKVVVKKRTQVGQSKIRNVKNRTRKGLEMKLNSADWSSDSSKYRLLPVSRFPALLKFISRAFCVAGIAIEEQEEDCLQN